MLQIFFANILADLYIHSDFDLALICGDVNARIGSMKDYFPEVDNVSDRCVLDIEKAGHCDAFIDFLNESKCSVMNGRGRKCHDNFTFMRDSRKSVVDYIAVNHDMLSSCGSFEVLTMTECIEKFCLLPLLSETSKLSDHSVVCAEFDFLLPEYSNLEENIHSCVSGNKTKYSRSLPPDFMSSELWKLSMSQLVTAVEQCNNGQQQVDLYYDKIM